MGDTIWFSLVESVKKYPDCIIDTKPIKLVLIN